MKKLLALTIAFFCIGSFADTLVAEWDFSKGIDSTDGKFKMKICGQSAIAKDSSGTFLRIDATGGKNAEGVTASSVYKELSPSEGFRIEVKFRIGNGKTVSLQQTLVDSKYVNYPNKTPIYNKGFVFYLIQFGKDSSYFSPQVSLGLGKESLAFEGSKVKLEPGKIYTFSFSWDGSQTAEFKVDGKLNGTIKIKGGAMAPAHFPFSIGDRCAPTFTPFNGDIYSVKLYSFKKLEQSVVFSADGRRAFIRNEKNANLKLNLFNDGSPEISNIVVSGLIDGKKIKDMTCGSLVGNGKVAFELPIETRLTPGKRPCKFKVDYQKEDRSYSKELAFDYMIAPLVGDRMPIVMFGAINNPYGLFHQWGFTHGLRYMYSGSFTRQLKNRYELLNEMYRQFDSMLMDGFRAVDNFHVDRFKDRFPRIGRDGKPYDRQNFDASNPEGCKLVEQIAEEAGTAFSGHPAVEGMLINSEVRDESRPSFTKCNADRWKKFSGRDVPDEVNGRNAPHWSGKKNFPIMRIIPDNDELYVFYKWWWREGDGWNPLHTLINRLYKKNLNRELWSFYDPAVRVPPVWGNGGEVDYLSHWTYAYPDPINIGANTSEMFAMAKGRPEQKIMNMTQLISYRSLTAPIGAKVKNPPAWTKEFPKASYITLAPDLMHEAVWVQISRKVSAIMFHGDEALFPEKDTYYTCTNDETRKVLKDFFVNVIRPLGPVLKRVPERPIKVAILESFASYVYAGRGTFGWYGWPFELNNALQWANLQPGVIYEEEILRDGFSEVDVLVMPHCDILTQSVYKKIVDFQRKGGIIVADNSVAPAIIPDITMLEVKRLRSEPLETKATLQSAGLKIRRELEPYFKPYVSATNPDIVTWVRSSGKADYLFAINDKRTFGDYYGQYGLVPEKGLPNIGSVTVSREAGEIYDLVKSSPVKFTVKDGKTTIPLDFKTNDGRLFLILPSAVGSIELTVPSNVEKGREFEFAATIRDASGEKIASIHPLEITVKCARGVKTDDSGFGAFENGVYSQKIVPPLNITPGDWTISVRDLASGKSVSKRVAVK